MSQPQFQYVTRRIDQDAVVLTLTATELCNDDLATAVRKELVAAIGSAAAPKVVLDFQNVTYIASPGIRLLLNIRRYVKDVSGQLVVCSLAKMVTDVLNTARLISTNSSSPPALLETAPDAAAAIGLLKRVSDSDG